MSKVEMETGALLNILIVNYNHYKFTVECLESIFKAQKFAKYRLRICIVDNSEEAIYSDILVRWCQGELIDIDTAYPEWVYPQRQASVDFQLLQENEVLTNTNHTVVTIIRQQTNKGFASANNLGIEYFLNFQDWQWVWLLNNDTVIAPDAIQQLEHYLQHANQQLGLVATKLFYYHQRDRFQAIGGKYNPYSTIVTHVGAHEEDHGQYDDYAYNDHVDYIIGASLVANRYLLADIGLMGDDYFLYFEELDLALRAKKAGWKLGFSTKTHVYHKEGGTINPGAKLGSSLLSDQCNAVNRIKIAKRFYPFTLPFSVFGVSMLLLNRLRRKQFNRFMPILKSLFKLSIK